ncbi:hypothetical protein rsdtw13_36220 [Clostridium sp. TW13]|uniref:Uncharacterized protein n=1 Tax=Inconstantimicrobium mannanitabidum TaxID=1604901 RepID=A0ACB5RH40_9CLOT|nr:hypothetical protein rsdtw13_36220 [Clostridium sp. TW13]
MCRGITWPELTTRVTHIDYCQGEVHDFQKKGLYKISEGILYRPFCLVLNETIFN